MIALRLQKTMRDKQRMTLTAFVFLLALAALSLHPLDGYSWDTSAYNTGKSLGSSMHHKLNNTEKIRNRFSNPVTSNGSSMSTMDNSKSFTAQLTAPSSNVFLDLFIAPSATGDLTTVTLRQDTNFDGTSDYAYSLSVPVSGVCSNGFISADNGTWDHRHYYTWVADTTGRVTASEVVSIDALSGCYCINSSCGSNLVWSNVGIILRDLGGGIVSAIQRQKTFTITSVNITGTEIKYYGQATSTMGNTSGVYFSGTPTPEQYYDDGEGSLPGDVELANQAGDPNSMYSQLNTLNSNIGNQYTTKTCSVKREASLHTDVIDVPVVSVNNPWHYVYIGDYSSGYVRSAVGYGSYIRIVMAYKDTWYDIQLQGFTATGGGTAGDCCFDEWGTPYLCPGDNVLGASGNTIQIGWATITLHGATTTVIPNSVCGGKQWVYGSGNTLKWYPYNHKGDDSNLCGGFTFHGTCPDGYTLDTITNKCVGNTTGVSNTTDTCSGIDLTNCSLSEETVCDHDDKGCVYTYKNHNPTGLTPIGSCYSEVSPYTGENWTFCANGSSLTYQQGSQTGVLESGTDIWWNIHRTYTCEANNVYDFTKAQQRAGHIQDTLSDNGSTLTYQDLNADTGEITDNSTALPPREDVERCEKSCIVRVPVQDTQASVTGTTADYRTSVNTTKEILRTCENGVCPVNPGETMIQDCKCTNYFNKAATTLQLLDNAGRDIICSGSPP